MYDTLRRCGDWCVMVDEMIVICYIPTHECETLPCAIGRVKSSHHPDDARTGFHVRLVIGYIRTMKLLRVQECQVASYSTSTLHRIATMAQPPHNPLLHPPFFEIPGINPSSPLSTQMEQIDQLSTLLLQEIDANFAKFHQIVTARILPEIKRFAIAGEPTREAAHVSYPCCDLSES